MQKINPTTTAAWQALEVHKADNLTIPQLFAEIQTVSNNTL